MGWFNEAYRGTPPWDIGHPQGEIVRLAQSGEIRGSVLDVGCGTGENSLFLAAKGHEVWGIDSAPLAIEKASLKARDRQLNAKFLVHDALDLPSISRKFDAVIDSGLFHVLSDEEREVFAKSLARVMRPGGTYFMLCFSDKEPDDGGPRRISEAEIRQTFRGGWRINYIRETRFEASFNGHIPLAYIASITRI
jgi:SAM-dependent methyltransferase